MTEAEAIEYQRFLDQKLAELMEHFDTVQIIVTRHNKATDITNMMAKGAGNMYARVCSMEAWLDDIKI